MKTVITYKNADLDCVASAYAYSEFLNKSGIQSNYYIGGIVQEEVNVICSHFGIELSKLNDDISNNEIIVVDTSTYSSIDFINPDQVVEILDHHPRSNDEYKNAKITIEQIGAVCTMIAEKFKNSGIPISDSSAILLYYGIISNTVNLKSKVTTDRDLLMIDWLKSQCSKIDESFISSFFKEKSKFDISDLRRAMEIEEKFTLGSDELIIGQLEVVGAREFLEKNKSEIDRHLDAAREQYGVSIMFMNIIDIFDGYHIIYSPYDDTVDYLKRFSLNLEGGILFEDKIVLRKEIKKYLRDTLDNRSFL